MSDNTRVPVALSVLSAGAIVLLAIMVSLLNALPAGMDAAAKLREQQLLETGISASLNDTAAAVASVVNRDAAVANLDRKFNRAWAEENVGTNFYSGKGVEYTAVIDGNSKPLYLTRRGESFALNEFEAFAPVLKPFIEGVRAKEGIRGQQFRPGGNGQVISDPIQVVGVVDVEGQIYMVTATLVQPDYGRVMPSLRTPIVITAKSLDASFIRTFAQRFLMHDLQIDMIGTPRGNVSDDGRARLVLHAPDGRAAGVVSWAPDRPGHRLKEKIMPLALGVMSVLIAAGVMAYMRLAKGSRDLMASESRARFIASHDGLTGLYNRAQFQERLEEAYMAFRTRGRPLAVLLLDLDHFKQVNDAMGHFGGDELLKITAARIKSVFGEPHAVARFGGDEFAVVVSGLERNEVIAHADRLLIELTQPADLKFGRVSPGSSIGICFADVDVTKADDCLLRADFALYSAKASGRRRHALYSPELASTQRDRVDLTRDLQAALASESLQVVYQPQGEISGKIKGVEALVRWTHPTRGPISPELFVALAEESDLINELGFFVLKRAFLDSLRWRDLRIAVNVSARQLRTPGFIERVHAMLVETKADPNRFEMEITERLLMGDDPHTHAVLEELHDFGFSIALDDFGAGYSNLAYLRRFPIDKIKIDKSFVDGLGADAGAQMLVSAIIQLARALRLEVIAEGVETIEQQVLLAAAGCPMIQGYLLSRALSPDALDAFLATRSGDPRQRLSVVNGGVKDY